MLNILRVNVKLIIWKFISKEIILIAVKSILITLTFFFSSNTVRLIKSLSHMLKGIKKTLKILHCIPRGLKNKILYRFRAR